MNLNIEINPYFEHLFDFWENQDSDATNKNTIESHEYCTSLKVPIDSLIKQAKPVVMERYEFGDREESL